MHAHGCSFSYHNSATSTFMTTNTPVEVRNYFKLDYLSGRSHTILRRLFKSRYKQLNNGAEWDDTPTSGASFCYNKDSITKVQQTSIKDGDSRKWDLTTLSQLLLKTMQPVNTMTPTEIQQFKTEDDLISKLKDIRNTLAHLSSKSLSNDEFHRHWADLSKILVQLGDDETELDKVKDNTLFEPKEQPINDLNLSEAEKLYASGMIAHRLDNFSEAVTLFIKATVLPGISNHDRAKYYSQLSASRLALYKQKQCNPSPCFMDKFFDKDDLRYCALHDAKQARTLWNTWWQGHYRVGKAYVALDEYESAIKSFERALALSPNDEKIENALKETRNLHESQSTSDSSDTERMTLIINPKLEQTSFDELVENYPAGANTLKGHQYAHGTADVKQNFEEAAKYYAKASNNGSAEAMYNLAYLTEHGFGVKKDHGLALRLYMQAAKQPLVHPYFEDSDNIGVKEAEKRLVIIRENNIPTDENSKENAEISEELFTPIDEQPTSTSFKPIYKLAGQSRIHDYNVLNEYAERGWKTAQIMRSSLEHFFLAISFIVDTDDLTENQQNEFVHELSQSYRIARIVIEFPTDRMRQQTVHIVNEVLHRCGLQYKTSTSQLDEDVRICHIGLHRHSDERIEQFLKQSMNKYPKTIFFIELSIISRQLQGHYETSLDLANKGLKINPKNCELLYLRAVALRYLGTNITETLKAYETFLNLAPIDHRKVPESYYAMGNCHLSTDESQHIQNIIRELYSKGEDAEKKQVPCFLPYKSENKQQLEMRLEQTSRMNNVDESTSSSNDSTQRLTNPERIEMISKHRQREKQGYNSRSYQKSQVKTTTKKSLIGLKSMSIKQMNSINDHIYEGYVLVVTIIEETHSWNPLIHLIVEDEQHDCQELHIDDFPETKGEKLVCTVYTIGSKMHIINPYRKIIGDNMKSIIYVNDFSSIMMQNESERVLNMCRCCGKSNSQYKCKRCHKAYYCSQQCQTTDWHIYKHEFICSS